MKVTKQLIGVLVIKKKKVFAMLLSSESQTMRLLVFPSSKIYK